MINRFTSRPFSKASSVQLLVCAAALALSSRGSVTAADYFWGFDADGNWTNSSELTGWNSTGAFPSAIGDSATLLLDITAPRAVTIDTTSAILGALSVGDTGGGTDSGWAIATSDALANKLTFDVTSGNAALTSQGATNTISAPIVLNDPLSVTTTNGLTISGIISGAGGIEKFGTGQTLTLSGTESNSYAGLTTMTAGTLSLAKTAGQNAISGDLTINAGTVILAAANQIANSATVTMVGGTLSFGGLSETINNLSVMSGTVSTSAGAATLAVSTATTLATGASITANATGGTRTFNLGELTLSGGTIAAPASAGNGRTVITATNLNIMNRASGAYTPVNLQFAATASNSQSSSLTFTGDLNFQKAPGDTNDNPVTIGTTGNGAALLSMSSAVTPNHTFTIEDGLAPVDLIIGARLSGGGNNLVKAGAGALQLAGPNSFSGTTKVTAGTLILGSDAASTTVLGSAMTASNATDVFTLTGNTLIEGNRVALTATTAPTTTPTTNMLVSGGIYFVRNVVGNTFQLSSTVGGAPIEFTSNGSGLQVTRVGALGAANSVVTLGDAALTQPTDTISLVSNGPFTNERAIAVENAGAGTTVGATNLTGTTARYTGTIALNKSVILGAANAGATTDFIGAIDDGAGSFRVSTSGDGIVNLSQPGGNTYDGGTTVNSGTLQVNNLNGSATGTGAVTVGSSGALEGSGIIAGNTDISGTHLPGNSTGIQTFGANLTYQSGASIGFDFAANSATQGDPIALFDQVTVGENLNFAGATALSLAFNPSGSSVDWSDSFWDSSRSWVIFDVTGTTTNFGNLTVTAADWLDAQGDGFDTILAGSSFSVSQSGNDVILNYVAVPEPSVFALLGLSAFGLWFPRRRASVHTNARAGSTPAGSKLDIRFS